MSAKKCAQLLLLLALIAAMLMTTSAARAATACGKSYTIIKGDTLQKIATKCGTTVSALLRANPEIGSGNLIYPGQMLLLPGATIYGNNGFNTYIVVRGDTLKALAARFNTSIDYLHSLNPAIANINVIYEGQRLVYPTAGGTAVILPVTGGNAYTVKKGDTLKKIAAAANTTVSAILQINPQITNMNLIYPGQVIYLPATGKTYIVQGGDTLKKIAAKFGTTLENLLALNANITNPNKIYVGQLLVIR